jgi:hypothetical protein
MANLSLPQVKQLCELAGLAGYLESDCDGKRAQITFCFDGAAARTVARYQREMIRESEKELRAHRRKILAAAKRDPQIARLVKSIEQEIEQKIK